MAEALTVTSRAERSHLRWIGLALGLAFGGYGAITSYLFNGHDLKHIQLPSYFLLYPLVGWGVGYSRERLTGDFFAVGPLETKQMTEWTSRLLWYVGEGILLGMAMSLTSALLDFLWLGWLDLDLDQMNGPSWYGSLCGHLITISLFGAMIGCNLGLRRGDPALSIRNVRFRTREILVLMAFCGLMLGIASLLIRYSDEARHALFNLQYSRKIAEALEQLSEQQRLGLDGAERAQALRQGQVPDGLQPEQTEFLRSLDAPGTDPEYRKQQFDLIAYSEENVASLAPQNLEQTAKLLEYHRAMEVKYRAAMYRPWLPVEPDPPLPDGGLKE